MSYEKPQNFKCKADVSRIWQAKGADALIIIGILGLVVAMIVGIMWWRAIL